MGDEINNGEGIEYGSFAEGLKVSHLWNVKHLVQNYYKKHIDLLFNVIVWFIEYINLQQKNILFIWKIYFNFVKKHRS